MDRILVTKKEVRASLMDHKQEDQRLREANGSFPHTAAAQERYIPNHAYQMKP